MKTKRGQIALDFLSTAKEHRQADYDCGRPWSCYCAACKCVRESAPELLYHLQKAVALKFGEVRLTEEEKGAILATISKATGRTLSEQGGENERNCCL